MMKIITNFNFSMIPGANNGLFKFHEIDKDQAKLLVKPEDCAYIPDHYLAEAVKKDLGILEVKEENSDCSFYDNDEFILVKNKDRRLLDNPIPQYFHCYIHSDGV